MRTVAIRVRRAVLIMTVVCVAVSGCGELHHKMEYEAATFTGPASGPYNQMITGEQHPVSRIQHRNVAVVYLRLPDGAVFQLTKLREKDLQQRKATRQDDPSGLTFYHLPPSNSTLHFRKGELVGAALADGIELSNDEKGPFVKLPLSAAQVRSLLGKPLKTTTFRGTPRWN